MFIDTPQKRSVLAAGVAVTGLAGALWFGGAGAAQATHQPADKIAVAGSALEIMSTPITGGTASEIVTLATSSLKTSSPTDLLLEVQAECGLWTDIANTGNSTSSAEAQVKVWVELDGQPVAVASDDVNEPGKVVFCDRTYKRTVTENDDEDQDDTIASYLATRSANGFEWMTLNVGSGVHTIEVKAQLTESVDGVGRAQAAVGKRTLVVQPVKLATDAEI